MKNPRIAAGVLVFRCNLPEVRSPDAFPFTELSISLLISVSLVVSQVPEVCPFELIRLLGNLVQRFYALPVFGSSVRIAF
jgi:hypothetical protein